MRSADGVSDGRPYSKFSLKINKMTSVNGILFASGSIGFGIYDWTTLLIYFAVLLGIAKWVVRQKTDTSQDYFLAGKKRAGSSSEPRFSLRISGRNISSASPVPERATVWPWRITNSMPGVCSCSAGSWFPFMNAVVFSRCRNFWKNGMDLRPGGFCPS